MTRPPDLPDFDAPPVIEVVVGVQFPTIDELCTAHVGAFWQRMRAAYPRVQDMPPLPAMYESSGKGPEGLEVPLLPLRRSFFISRDGAWLVQLQSNRLLHNWRKQSDTDSYPRYEACLDRFQIVWREYRKFLADEKVPVPAVDQLAAHLRQSRSVRRPPKFASGYRRAVPGHHVACFALLSADAFRPAIEPELRTAEQEW